MLVSGSKDSDRLSTAILPSKALRPFPELPYSPLGLPQYETERVLAGHLGRFGINVERGVTLTALSQNKDGVTVQLKRSDGKVEEATFRYVIGCDGAHSAVRRQVGIDFEGCHSCSAM